MLGFWIIVCHLLGDYVFQSHWMATEKTKSWYAATIHAFFYFIPFYPLLLVYGPRSRWACLALAVVIIYTHLFIDRLRMARYVIWLKNWMGPRRMVCVEKTSCYETANGNMRNAPWPLCSKTGFGPEVPDWLAVLLLIIVDNTMHLLIAGLAFSFIN